MYNYSLKPPLRQRVDETMKHHQRGSSFDRFSSFETPPPSDNEDFSDFDNSNSKHPGKQKSQKKKKSYILVEELPVQYDKSVSAKKYQNELMMSSKDKQTNQNYDNNLTENLSKNRGEEKRDPFKYDYIGKVEK